MTNIDKLKAIKAPFWSRWLGEYRAWKRAKIARKEALNTSHYVCTYNAWFGGDIDGVAWYICMKDGTGQRYYEYNSTCEKLMEFEERNQIYAHAIVPWLDGALSDDTLIAWANMSMQQKTHG